MTVTIRAARPEDVEALAALAAVTFPMAAPDDAEPAGVAEFIATVLSTERFAGYIADPTRVVLVAEHTATGLDHGTDRARRDGAGSADGLVGYAMLIHGEPLDPDVQAAVRTRPTVDLNKFYVHPDHHGEGVAAALMTGALDTARAAGMESVWLGVNDENQRAIRFYRKQGFLEVGTKWFRLGERDERDFVMERRLA